MSCIIEQGIAGADLSAKQNTFVFADGTDSESIKAATSDTSIEIVGVLVNTPADTETAHIAVGGCVDVIAGGALEPWDLVTTNASGQAVVAATGKVLLGQYRPKPEGGANRDAASGEKVRIYLFDDKTRLKA